MRSSFVQFAFIVLALVLGGAVEDVLPSFGGVGFPFLLGAAVFFAFETRAPVWVFAAGAAGALEESLSSLPPATAIVFFLATASAVRFLREPLVCFLSAYPVYQLWLGLVSEGSGVFGRILLAVPVGALSLTLVVGLLERAWRKAGANA